MLRNFPSKYATEDDLRQFQMNSDALLKAVSSTPLSSQSSKPSPTTPYNNISALSNLTNLSSELLDNAAGDVIGSPDDDEDEKDTSGEGVNTGDESDAGLLAMIFKIVPIGMNIVSRGKTIATGFKETTMGIVDLIKNTALLTAITTMDSITFGFQFAIFIFKLLLCSVNILSNFPKCVIFYIIDIIVFVVFVCIVSILFIIDVFLMVKMWAGISCVELFLMLLNILEQIDKTIYSIMSFHIIHYPDSIIKMCYTCSSMGDTSGFKSAASRLFQDIFVKLPSGIGEPIGETLTGIGHIFSFLNLK